MTNTPKKRIGYIDALRGFTMLLVVYTHIQLFCYGQFCHLDSSIGLGSNTLVYRDLIALFFMPLFFFISGFVLYKQDMEWSIGRSIRFVGRKALLLLLPTVVFISLYIIVFDPPMSLLYQSGRLGYWFTIALFEYYLFYALYRLLCSAFHCHNGIDWVLLASSTMLYFTVTQSVLNRLGMSNETISLLGLAELRFFFYFAIGTLVRKHFHCFEQFMSNSKLVAMWLIAFFGMFILVHRDGFVFANAMVYHAYNFIGGLMALFLVFLFFYKYQSAFEDNHKIGNVLQYVGRHTLAIYMLHYFFLPRNLQFIGDFFMQHSNPTIELFISIAIAALVIGISLITNALICTSPLLAHYLFGERTNQIQNKT